MSSVEDKKRVQVVKQPPILADDRSGQTLRDETKKAPGGGGKAPPEKPTTCEPSFVTGRRGTPWYLSNGSVQKTKCEEPTRKTVEETVSIRVYWLIVGNTWTRGGVESKLEATKKWFARYCITIPFDEVKITKLEQVGIEKSLDEADANGRDAYGAAAKKILDHVWQHRLSKPQQFLLILFVNAFKEVEFSANHISDVSGNFAKIPVILITSNDADSTHIVTHELIHGFGKNLHGATSDPWAGMDSEDKNNTWMEGGCPNDMGNAGRSKSMDPFPKTDADLMDWASYWQMLHNAGTIK